MSKKVDGPGLAALAVGFVFMYAGVKGYSPLRAFQNIIQGKHPNEGQSANALTAPNVSGSSVTSGANAPTDASEKAWIAAFLAALNAPNSSANANSLASWMRHEFGSWPPSAKNNPFATTQPMPGSTQFNSVGVQNYVTAQDGINANAATITNGRYSKIVAALRSGNGICGNAFADEFSTWSGGGYSSVC